MRLRFSDIQKIKKEAKNQKKTVEDSLAEWYADKHKLPMYDDSFLNKPIEVHLKFYYRDLIEKRKDMKHMLSSSSLQPHERTKVMKGIEEIDRILEDNDTPERDPLVAIWEAQLAAGLEPDMELTMDDVKNGKF